MWFANKNEICGTIIKCWCRASEVNARPNIYSSAYGGSSSKAHAPIPEQILSRGLNQYFCK